MGVYYEIAAEGCGNLRDGSSMGFRGPFFGGAKSSRKVFYRRNSVEAMTELIAEARMEPVSESGGGE